MGSLLTSHASPSIATTVQCILTARYLRRILTIPSVSTFTLLVSPE